MESSLGGQRGGSLAKDQVPEYYRAIIINQSSSAQQSKLIMAKNKKANAWQIIVAVFQALAALFGSLKKSHDSAKADSDSAEADKGSQDSSRQNGLR